MQVLASSEYLDTEEKKQAYLDYKLEMSKLVRMGLGFIGSLEKGATGERT
jgi:hypothetical protein